MTTHQCEDPKYTKVRDTWVCTKCGLIAPKCFTPKPDAMAPADRFVLDHIIIIPVS